MQTVSGDKPEKRYKFIIEFGLHCFTKAPNEKKNEKLSDFPSDRYYSDSRETRIFCFDRHKLSFGLPEIARSLANRQCYHTGKGNFFLIEFINSNGQKEEYEVYFNVTRTTVKGLLRLFITSAYIRDDEHEGSQPEKKKINFFVIAHKIQINQKIKAP